jgi:putative hemolysin
MGSNEIVMVITLVFLILLSSFFSATETAFSSLNQIKIKHLAQNNHKGAKRTLKLSEDFDKVLTTILIGNNIVNIFAASLATVLFLVYLPTSGVLVSTIVMTTLVLIFGEITPKSLAKKIPEKFALTVTPVLILFIILLTPLNFIFGLWQKLMNKLIKIENEIPTTEDELLTYVSEVQQEGGINENEGDLIRSVIDFDDLIIEEIFTPRVNVIAVSENDTLKKITSLFRQSGYSRLPVYKESIDHIYGVINHKDFYNRVLLDKESLESIIKPAVYVTEYMKVSNLLELLQENKSHMAIVKDEFGGTLGIVTMEDILEEIVGDIWDEHDEVIEAIVKMSDDTYKVKGYLDLEDFFESIDIELKEDLDVSTINGLAQDLLGKIPEIGDKFKFMNLEITITSADTKKVLEATVNILPVEPDDNE